MSVSAANNHISSELNTYLVGGAVRDQLLGRQVTERDYLVVGATPEQMLELGFMPVGKDFPVFLHPTTKEEYALARTERKQGQGYTGFVCYADSDVTIEEDLKRRDLTVNAMAMSDSGEIIDPYNGQQDLENKLLRHVSEAFVEDPLRVLRVARFAARYYQYGFSVAPETVALMAEIAASGELQQLTAERVWKEMQRSLDEANPEVFFSVLRLCGALKELFPELDVLWGIPNPQRWHPEICSGLHTMMVLQQAVKLSDKTSVRFAALCHDLGKGLTEEEKLPSHPGHETSGLPLVEAVCQRFKVPNDSKRLALKVCEFHLMSHKAFDLRENTILKLFNQLDTWRKPEEFEDFLLSCEADYKGRLGFEDKPYPQAAYLRAAAQKASAINAKAFVEQGLKGVEIKKAIDAAKLTAIGEIKAQLAHTAPEHP
ncbi:multifunctional CCA addition/repair protein [Thalassomonas viridans]|uniref:Multifunctional CCA protein n=1 Tax=Thalassomonas viridans TaxID=137584 RepID=A0AAF0C810_9GAMM|nr:multifunctional CCA addition/repair protein [Thalassomonas viridans]WDE04243.1 multifunctional CCA addition/repair protein [Thalassomonas viridans]